MSRAFVIAALWLATADAGPQFVQTELSSSNGAALLRWSGSGDRFEVQRAPTPQFRDVVHVYRGNLPSAHVSGLRDGTYWFRVRATQPRAGAWSSAARVQVEHHPMSLVWPMFAVGAVVFLATAGVVARHRTDALEARRG